MAAKHRQTTSSISLDEKENERPTDLPTSLQPNGGVGTAAHTSTTPTQISPKLDESYQLIKQQQQKYNELSARLDSRERQVAVTEVTKNAKDEGEWQQVCSAKNKLKRKKKLSTSLTSMSDAVNQEKRTRIEGIQLNCRGKLRPSDTNAFAVNTSQPTPPKAKAPTNERTVKAASHTGRPPVPPKSERGGVTPTPPPAPPRLKRKLQENVQTIQKLNALTDQLRLEINELKSNLISERGAVRTLRAQNESESRKWKNEVKKLQHTLDLIKKNQATQTKRLTEAAPEAAVTQAATAAAGSHVVNYEIQRLTNELNLLKEANKALEEKKVINCDADRRKAADMRTLKDTYEIRLTQLKKSAKIEITRLLEEIKTKERNIGQLKKDLQILQNTKTNNNSKESSKNATTKNQTTNNKSNKKPKKPTKDIQALNKDEKNSAQVELEIKLKDINQAQVTDEMTQLKDIELIRNTRNIHKIPTENNQTKSPNNMLPSLDINTTTAEDKIIMKEYHSLPHEISHCLLKKTSTETQTHERQQEFRPKDSNSDSDSALSSAPPSISPQPPPAGLDSADIWQTIRTYTQDIEKLQKEIELLHNENERLQAELNVAKEEILNSEKCALEATTSLKLNELNEKIKQLEEQEHHLQSEANELREQNELLEFRILELEESNDKWSLQSNTPSTETSATNTSMATAKDVWSCNKELDDPIGIYGNTSLTMDSGITSPHIIDEELTGESHDHLCRRLRQLLMKCNALDAGDKLYLQQLLNYLQQLDLNALRSGPESLNANSSGEEPSSLEVVKSRVSDYSSGSASSTPGARLVLEENCAYNNKTGKSFASSVSASNARIVATVQPYNSCVPTNTPTDSPRKTNRLAWQSNSLSESGVFVESDFIGDSGPKHAHTQTEFEYETSVFQRVNSGPSGKTLFALSNPPLPHPSELLKRLQYYKDRLDLVERKVIVYESSGDIQAKHLADRLQREIQLEKQLKELLSRVELLENENSTLEEEKCEFEEAENDTRLRLQRLEVELEILAQRNVELELSKEALSAKYKDCRAESQILQDDIVACETRICNLEEDRKLAKQQLSTLQKSLPLIVMYKLLSSVAPLLQANYSKQSESESQSELNRHSAGYCSGTSTFAKLKPNADATFPRSESNDSYSCEEKELTYLKEEVKNLRSQIKELNSRHYEAMETADSHWVDLEREYKEREEAYRAKEVCLKQKITKLQDCLRDDARAANEKIQQLEETEQGLKTCLVRISKDHRELLEEHNCVLKELECYKEQKEQIKDQQKPLMEALESERRRSKNLIDELTFVGKLQQNSEDQFKKEADDLRKQIFDMRKEYLHIEVTNGELKEEVSTLEAKISELQVLVKDHEERERVLQDELRTKEELYEQLEQKCNERENNYSLAQELCDSPSKRFRRDQIKDLKTASKGLGNALRNLERCELELPTHMQFHSVARDVKKLADTLLNGDGEELLSDIEHKIHECLLVYHNSRVEAEFCCTIYYPVKRPVFIKTSD